MNKLSTTGVVLTALALHSCCDDGDHPETPALTPLDVSFESQLVAQTGSMGGRSTSALDLDGDGLVDLVTLGVDGTIVVALGQSAGVFVESQTLVGPAGFGSLRSADLDGDGDEDFLSIVAASGEAEVFLNDGTGMLANGPTFSVGQGATDFILVSIDGSPTDGVASETVDLIVARSGRRDLELYSGNGDGTFGSVQRFPVPRGDLIGGLSVGDFDGDGGLDVAFADADLSQVTIVVDGDSMGKGSASTVQIPVPGTPFRTAAADLDGDGIDEVLVGDIGVNELLVLDGVLGEVSQRIPLAGGPVDIDVGDVSGDGILDVAVAIANRQTIAIVYGEMQPTKSGGSTVILLPTNEMMYVGGSPTTPLLRDLDQDSDLDLLVSSIGQPTVDLFFNEGGELSGGSIFIVEGLEDVANVAPGRFDPNGAFQLAVAESGAAGVTLTDFRGLTASRIETPPVDFLAEIQLPGDDLTDLLVSVEGGVLVLRNVTTAADTEPKFEQVGGSFVIAGAGALEAILADLNGDTVPDLAASIPEESRIAVALGSIGSDGALSFGAPLTLALGGNPSGITAGDFDGDGMQELAVSRVRLSMITILELVDGALELRADFPVAAGPTFLVAGDLDGDEFVELIVAETFADQVSVLRDDGSGGFLVQEFGAGNDPTALVLSDLSNDGVLDLLVTEFQGDQFQVLIGNGSGGFAQAQPFAGPSRVFSATLADVDGDDLDDLVVGSIQTGGFGVFLNTSVPSQGL